MTWRTTQLTFGTPEGRYHAHSYYDIPVLDAGGTRILAYRTAFMGRQPSPDDAVEVGTVPLDGSGEWTPIGCTSAWSWQQGPMAQWVGKEVAYNDREGDAFVARIGVPGGAMRTLRRPIYAVAPRGGFALGVDMARLELLRPGYGYAGGPDNALGGRAPSGEGVWRLPLDGAEPTLALSLADAVRCLRAWLPPKERVRHRLARYAYWFNHAKLSPDERRFTVKLRWRKPGGPWNGRMGVSLTGGADGKDIRVLADGTSHVMWLDDAHLYTWRAGELAVFADEPGGGRRTGTLGGGAIDANVHLRHLPTGATTAPTTLIYDTPYKRDIDLYWHDVASEEREVAARFTRHDPSRGPFRCDLHPVPLEGRDGAVVTSLQDGGRQLYLIHR